MKRITDETICKIRTLLAEGKRVTYIVATLHVSWPVVTDVRDGERRLSTEATTIYCGECGAWVEAPCVACRAREHQGGKASEVDADRPDGLVGGQEKRRQEALEKKKKQQERYPAGRATQYVRTVYRVQIPQPRHPHYGDDGEDS